MCNKDIHCEIASTKTKYTQHSSRHNSWPALAQHELRSAVADREGQSLFQHCRTRVRRQHQLIETSVCSGQHAVNRAVLRDRIAAQREM